MNKEPITLATLPQATEQEVFDQVARHLLTQGAFARIGSAGRCVFRTSSGLKCAAGCLISDEEYASFNKEGAGTQNNRLEEAGGWCGNIDDGNVPEDHRDLIIALQIAHDKSQCITELPGKLIRLAVEFKLNHDVVREFHPTMNP